MRSETDQVFANPDGTMTREQSLEPVRVRRGERWLDVDSALVRAADGSWGPKVGSVPISFSGGGSAPLVAMEQRGVKLSLSWPGGLPAPSVDGNEVTYAEVYPGVDLKMAAVGTSFTQRLVVKSRTAGVNPKVRALSLRADVAGGTIAASGLGYVVKDRLGEPTLTGSQPLMWDSAAAKKSPAATEGLEEGDAQAPMGLSVSRTSMGLAANTALLDDPGTVFPVVLDPTGSPSIYNWAMVNKAYASNSYYNFTSSDEGVGYNNFEGINTKRIYYSFPTSSYNSSTIISATLSAFETYSATCAAGTVNAYLSGDVSSSTTWNNQPAKITGVLAGWSTKAGRSDCYPGGKTASWNVTTGVKNRVTAKASRSTFVLQGSTESSYASWMRFAGPKNTNSSYRPKLSVTYNSAPYGPSVSSMWVPTTSKGCTASASTGPVINPKVGASEAMYAKITDPNSDALTSQLELLKGDSTHLSYTDLSSRASGSTISVTVPSTLADGVYKFRVRAKDSYVWGSWGQYCYFTVDTTKPQLTVTSPTWPDGVLAPAEATAGSFVMTAPGSSSISYRWNSVATASSGAPNSSGQVTAAATTTRTLDYWRAQASDPAGNTSDTQTYYVKRTQPAKLAQYLFDSASPLADSATSQLNSTSALSDPDAASAYTFNIDPSFGSFSDTGRFDLPGGQAALFDGSGQVASVATRPVVSERSFTVGAWVFMGDADQPRTVLSQLLDANPTDPTNPGLAFDLGYDATADKFVARVMNAAGSVVGQAVDSLPVNIMGDPANAALTKDGSWVYLAMVYDAAGNTLRLDANHSGNADPPDSDFSTLYRGTETPVTAPVAAARGEFRIGGGSSAQGERAGWSGAVDNLAIWQGVPSEETILSNANIHQ